jgi:RNA polymerase sigma-B factor
MAPTDLLSPPVSAQARGLRAREDAQRFERYHRDRDPADRAELVERHMPLVNHLARRYGDHGEREDVTQVAAIGLLKAIDRYDPGRGIAFSSFAFPTILGEIKRYYRDRGWSVRVPRELQELALRLDRVSDELTGTLGRAPTVDELAARCETTPEQVLEARATTTAHRAISLDQPARDAEDGGDHFDRLGSEDPGFDRVENATHVDRLLATLPERQREMLLLRFRDDLTQQEIGQLMGVSQMHVSRLIRQSLTTLHDGQAAAHP